MILNVKGVQYLPDHLFNDPTIFRMWIVSLVTVVLGSPRSVQKIRFTTPAPSISVYEYRPDQQCSRLVELAWPTCMEWTNRCITAMSHYRIAQCLYYMIADERKDKGSEIMVSNVQVMMYQSQSCAESMRISRHG